MSTLNCPDFWQLVLFRSPLNNLQNFLSSPNKPLNKFMNLCVENSEPTFKIANLAIVAGDLELPCHFCHYRDGNIGKLLFKFNQLPILPTERKWQAVATYSITIKVITEWIKTQNFPFDGNLGLSFQGKHEYGNVCRTGPKLNFLHS